MGCGTSLKSKESQSPIRFRMKTKEITITPGTFVKLSHDCNIAEYKEIKKLGAGAFSYVLLCDHLPTKTKRALKIVHKSGLTCHQRDPIHMLKEIQILKMLDHPNIIKCFEIFEDEDRYYIAAEYCPGGDLFGEILKLQQFTEAQTAKIVFQLLSAISYCHEKLVTHRDLKPENILLTENNGELHVKIADFGSSCVFEQDSRLTGCFGSSYYLAPEIFYSSYDQACDLWSVGIIMYILLTGTPPYQGKDSASIISQIQETPFKITPSNVMGLSPDSINLLRELLCINPIDRITAKSAIRHPWIENHRNFAGESMKLTLSNLRTFNCQSKLREAVQIFLAAQITSHEEIKKVQKNFQALDKDGNGKITRSELLEEYLKVMEFNEANALVDEVLEKLDQNNDGDIDYTEFLISCSKNFKKVSKDNLVIAFNMFDIDGNGKITVDEIKAVLQNEQISDEDTWIALLQEADVNNDGCIDLKEFISLMTMKL